MANSWYKAAKDGVLQASNRVNTNYSRVMATAMVVVANKKGHSQPMVKEPVEEQAQVEKQDSEPTQNSVSDPTGKVSMNLINRCASLLDEDDAREWDDAYLRPDIVNQDKARVRSHGLVVENGEWVYLLGPDRQ